MVARGRDNWGTQTVSMAGEGLPTEAELLEPSRRAINAGLKPWRPGQSGNPSGVARVIFRSRRLFQHQSEELTQRLIDLALHAEDERVAAMCTIHALDRAGIRPIDYDPSTDRAAAGLDVDRLTPEERAQLRALVDKARVEGRGAEADDDGAGAGASIADG